MGFWSSADACGIRGAQQRRWCHYDMFGGTRRKYLQVEFVCADHALRATPLRNVSVDSLVFFIEVRS